ncbi:tyrosine-protein kinase HCK-like [Ruditapes philippinarum]|uniref:tyrosine-protein kinase HCK-like n=1 Tax=Ruditapes philippinarum TaxID=129788 RepID=UPI00295AC3E9|nr:tyrosine-protein kinase HCK-like [Ruditapes philippinarum]
MTVPENEELRVAHYMIKSQNGQFFISNKSRFDDIFSLVDNYRRGAGELLCKLMYTVPKQPPVVYPRTIEVHRQSVELKQSVKVGKYGKLFVGKLFKAFDVTVVTKCKSEVDKFLAEAKIPFDFRQSKHFVRMIAVVIKPEPFMIILGETVHDTLPNYLRNDRGKTLSFKDLTKMASEVLQCYLLFLSQ